MNCRPSFGRLHRAILLLSLVFCPGVVVGDGFRVVVSVKPIHSIVASLMEGVEGPELLIGDGSSPYGFELTEPQKRGLEEADLVVWVGPELEASIAGAIEALGPQVRTVELLSSRTMKILPSRSDGGSRDPFFWLDNRNVILMADDIARLLMDADPNRAHVYARNRRALVARLARIDREYEYGYRGFKAGLGVQYYDTLQYFEQAYALKIIEHVAGSPRESADAAAMIRARGYVARGEAVCLFTEQGMPPGHLSVLTEGNPVNLGRLDSLGDGLVAGPDLYFELMAHNTETIKRCLNADMEAAARARDLAADAPAAIGGPGDGRFLLTDHLGRLVSRETMNGKFQILYFGYTFCPDICPNSLQVLFAALDRIGDKAQQIQPYFVTVDPDRDTIAVMRNYVGYFDDRLIGVTGSEEMIAQMAAQFRVKYEKVEADSGDPGLYLMDHSASLYLLGPDGQFITKFMYGVTPEDLAGELAEILP